MTYRELENSPEMLEEAGVMWAAFCMEKGETDPDVEYWVEQMRVLLDRGMLSGLLAEQDGKTVGFAEGIIVYEPSRRRMQAMGRTVFVLPSHRASGLATEIGMRMLASAIERGAKDVVVHGELIPKLLDKAVDNLPGTWDHLYRVEVG